MSKTSEHAAIPATHLGLLLLVLCSVCNLCSSWSVMPTSRRLLKSRIIVASTFEGDEPDLFEYFDPLLSPHAYPDGISPKNKPKKEEKVDVFSQAPPWLEESPAALQQQLKKEQQEKQPEMAKSLDTKNMDLFEYFDPLLSPHAYPNGIDQKSRQEPDEERYNALKLASLSKQQQGKSSSFKSSSSSGSGRVGILLVDHGSRNEASNQRLVDIAKLYELTVGDDSIVVRS